MATADGNEVTVNGTPRMDLQASAPLLPIETNELSESSDPRKNSPGAGPGITFSEEEDDDGGEPQAQEHHSDLNTMEGNLDGSKNIPEALDPSTDSSSNSGAAGRTLDQVPLMRAAPHVADAATTTGGVKVIFKKPSENEDGARALLWIGFRKTRAADRIELERQFLDFLTRQRFTNTHAADFLACWSLRVFAKGPPHLGGRLVHCQLLQISCPSALVDQLWKVMGGCLGGCSVLEGLGGLGTRMWVDKHRACLDFHKMAEIAVGANAMPDTPDWAVPSSQADFEAGLRYFDSISKTFCPDAEQWRSSFRHLGAGPAIMQNGRGHRFLLTQEGLLDSGAPYRQGLPSPWRREGSGSQERGWEGGEKRMRLTGGWAATQGEGDGVSPEETEPDYLGRAAEEQLDKAAKAISASRRYLDALRRRSSPASLRRMQAEHARELAEANRAVQAAERRSEEQESFLAAAQRAALAADDRARAASAEVDSLREANLLLAAKIPSLERSVRALEAAATKAARRRKRKQRRSRSSSSSRTAGVDDESSGEGTLRVQEDEAVQAAEALDGLIGNAENKGPAAARDASSADAAAPAAPPPPPRRGVGAPPLVTSHA